MALKAVLFDFNGVIIDDERLHRQLLEEILHQENLRPQPGEFERFCLGRSDRVALQEILSNRGRSVTSDQIERLVAQKSEAYHQYLANLAELPLFPGLVDLVKQLHAAGIKLGIVTGALPGEVVMVLERTQLRELFTLVITDTDVNTSKPDPTGYLLAVQGLSQRFPEMELTAADCLAIEDSFVGITAAKRAEIEVVGVAHTYPFHMLQRRANWTVDFLQDLELERIQAFFAGNEVRATSELVGSEVVSQE
jgi:HAD superfamily hydrolase (TIGR01509 family)